MKKMTIRSAKAIAAGVLSTALVLGGTPAIVFGGAAAGDTGIQAAYAVETFSFGTKDTKLAPGVYDLSVGLKNASDTSSDSMAAGALESAAQLIVADDGSAKIRTVWIGLDLMGITAYADELQYFEDAARTKSVDATVIDSYSNGSPRTVEFTVSSAYKATDGVMISMAVSGAPMPGRVSALLTIDYTSAKAGTLKTPATTPVTPVVKKVTDNTTTSKSAAKTFTVNVKTVNASAVAKAAKKAGATKASTTSITLGKKVKAIKSGAFKGYKKLKTVTVKTKKLKKSKVKNAFRSTKVKTVKVAVGNKKANKKYVKSYKKVFTKKTVGKKVAVK